jgi:hypothetical protein
MKKATSHRDWMLPDTPTLEEWNMVHLHNRAKLLVMP